MEDERSSNVVIEIEELQTSRKITGSSEIEEHICDIQNNIPDPLIVSIGPYHHGKNTLQVMEKKKWNCLDNVLKANINKQLKDYTDEIWKLYPLARSYYGKEVQMEDKEFVHMLLLDGCFVLMALFGEVGISCNPTLVSEKNHDDDISTWQYNFVLDDLLLTENQIPFFVVKRIYELMIGEGNFGPSLSHLTTGFVEKILYEYPKAIDEWNRPHDFHHLLHLCHMYLKPSQNDYACDIQMDYEGLPITRWRKAVEYHIAGVRFEKRVFDKNNPHSLLDVRFRENVIEIPCLIMDENITSILRNLVTFEKSGQFGNDIIAYVIFMSHLICDAKDASLLVSNGIIEHHFHSDDEVADNFTELSDSIVFYFGSRYYLKNICYKLEEYYQGHVKSWKAWFRRTTSRIRGQV